MKFSAVVGNPPYQVGDNSGASSDAALPLYNKFVEHGINLNPEYVSMIVPGKWMVGGRGLNKFRDSMKAESRLKFIRDFENSAEVFPQSIHIDGGVCYFLWDKSYNGKTKHVYTSNKGDTVHTLHDLKNEYFDYVIRDSRILSILSKVASGGEKFSRIVSSTKPYGIRKDLFNSPERYPQSGLSFVDFTGSVKIYGVKGIKGGARRVVGYVRPEMITSSLDSVDKYKLFFTTTYSTNAVIPPEIIIGEPGDVCTETFLLVGPFDSQKQQYNCKKYMETNFFRMLLYYGKGTMQVTKSVFDLIPLVDFSEEWTDKMLYEHFGLSDEEIAFVETTLNIKK